MAVKTSWHRYVTNLRHCYLMYILQLDSRTDGLLNFHISEQKLGTFTYGTFEENVTYYIKLMVIYVDKIVRVYAELCRL